MNIRYILLFACFSLATGFLIQNSEPVNNAFPSTKTSELYGTNVPRMYIEDDIKTNEQRKVFLNYDVNDPLIDRLWCPQTFQNSRRGYFGRNSKHQRIMCKENYGEEKFECEITKLTIQCKSLYVNQNVNSVTRHDHHKKHQPSSLPLFTDSNSSSEVTAALLLSILWKVVSRDWIYTVLGFFSFCFLFCVFFFIAKTLFKFIRGVYARKHITPGCYCKNPANTDSSETPFYL
uniref:Uncharacterized protein n=1 Tax=Panagrolaimus superbus TaxID=310955 RepID=A0A914ZAQ6_9BILA